MVICKTYNYSVILVRILKQLNFYTLQMWMQNYYCIPIRALLKSNLSIKINFVTIFFVWHYRGARGLYFICIQMHISRELEQN